MADFAADGERTLRLLRALPKVSEAVHSQRIFREDSAKIWNDLRRGLNDLRKDPSQLEALKLPADRCIDDVWEFVLALMLASPKFARQIMDAVAVLLESRRWALQFLDAKGRSRLALWKFSGAPNGVGASPVALTLALLQLGAPVDELLPAPEVMENAAGFLDELFSRSMELNEEQRRLLEASQLAAAWRAEGASRDRASSDLGGQAGDDAEKLAPSYRRPTTEEFGFLTEANEAQVASIEEAGKQDRRLGCRKDIVDSLLDVAAEAFDCAAKCLEPMLSGYSGEQNIALSAKTKVLEFRQRQANLQAQLVVLGPCQAGKTSLTYALVGFAALPPETPSMVTTRWVHTPSLAVPKLTVPEALAELLQCWNERLRDMATSTAKAALAPVRLGDGVEGIDAVASALERIHQTVHRGRLLGVINSQELEALSRPAMSLSVEVAFAALASLEERLADTGTLSLVDLPSPDIDVLWDRQDMCNLCRRALQEADGVLVVVDASRHEAPRWLADLLRDAFLQERLLRREDAWVIANRIDHLGEFFCEDGVAEVCRRAKERQHRNYHDVILDQDRVIPTAAHLSLLAIYGLRQVGAKITPRLLGTLSRQPWFAQVCSFLFGVRWASQVRNMDRAKWRQSMRELQLLGQVTGPLANSVLKTAYVKMLPRSVARVMFDLSQLIAHFVTTLRTLEGGTAAIDGERLKLVFQTYFDDAKRRVLGCFEKNAPGEAEIRRVAAARCGAPVVFEDPDSAELNEKYFTIVAREAISSWQPGFVQAVTECCEEAGKAHQKWLRSIDHYLVKGGVHVATKQKVLLDSKNLRLVSNMEGLQSPLDDNVRDRLVLQHAEKVSVTTSKQLFQRTRRSYLITPGNVCAFLLELCKAWMEASSAEIERRCIQPIQRNFEEMFQGIEELNCHRMAGVWRPKARRECFDFGFARRLEEVLPQVATFDAEQGDASDVLPAPHCQGAQQAFAIEAAEAERCETFCEEVRAVLREIQPQWPTAAAPRPA